jgi:hypothetical protein
MFERKVIEKVKRMVWRMSATNPAGEFVLHCEPQSKRPDPGDIHERGVHASSLDLSTGSDVIETDMDTLPGELVDEFLKRTR